MSATTTAPKQDGFSIGRLLLEGRAFFALIAIIAVFSFLSPNYFTVSNFLIMSSQVAIYGILSVGMLLVILTGGIDLSVGSVLALAVGVVFALLRLSPKRIISVPATIVLEFFRGVPALLVLIAFGYAVPYAFGIRIDTYMTVMLALGIVESAYIAETIRAGIQAVPKGQVEADRSLGMPAGMAMRKIVLPQAFRIILPPLTNEVILLTKDSSLVYVLGLAAHEYELTKFGRDGISALDAGMTPILVAGLFYLVITVPLSLLARRFEARSTKKGH